MKTLLRSSLKQLLKKSSEDDLIEQLRKEIFIFTLQGLAATTKPSLKSLTKADIKDKLVTNLKGLIDPTQLEEAVKVVDKLPKKAISDIKHFVPTHTTGYSEGYYLPSVIGVLASTQHPLPRLSSVISHEFAHAGFGPIFGRLYWREVSKALKNMANPRTDVHFFIQDRPSSLTRQEAIRITSGIPPTKPASRVGEALAAYISQIVEAAATSKELSPYYGHGVFQKNLTETILREMGEGNPWMGSYRFMKKRMADLVKLELGHY